MRAVIWTQGCSLSCPGCFNPQTHPTSGGGNIQVLDLFQRIVELGPAIEGITLSGGEPLQQRRELIEFLALIRAQTGLSVILFTGHTLDELEGMPDADRLLACVDVLIAGRYVAAARVAHGLRGSSNKSIQFLTPRYSLADLDRVPDAEVIIGPEGTIRLSGMEPPHLRG